MYIWLKPALVIKLYIYEDDKDLREGLANYLSSAGDFNVVCCFENCDTKAIDLRRQKWM